MVIKITLERYVTPIGMVQTNAIQQSYGAPTLCGTDSCPAFTLDFNNKFQDSRVMDGQVGHSVSTLQVLEHIQE